jgi:hypothetical protein
VDLRDRHSGAIDQSNPEVLALELELAGRPPRGRYSDFPVLKAVFPIDGLSIEIGKQPALCLGQMQVDGSGLTSGGQQLPDIVHVRAWLVFRFKLLQRDQRRRQCFRDNPFVVASDSLLWHLARPRILLS